MRYRVGYTSLLSALLGSAAMGQAQDFPPGWIDPEPVLAEARAAYGADSVSCITAKGTINAGKVGQEDYIQWQSDWPEDELTEYVRVMDWERGTLHEEFNRDPALRLPAAFKYGNGFVDGTPLQQNERMLHTVRDAKAWYQDGEDGEPVAIDPDLATHYQLDLYLNPIGFLKAAELPGANPRAVWRYELGEMGRDGPTTLNEEAELGYPYITRVVIIDVLGHTIDATVNPEGFIQRLHTEVKHPVLGAFNIEQEFTNEDTIDVGDGVKWPTGWHSHQGYDDNYQYMHDTTGHNAFGGDLSDITVNGCEEYPIPESVANATFEETVTSDEIADGVYVIGGSSHNSVAIEFEDFIAVVEAPLDEERSLAVIDHVVELIPDKPIRFVFNTHQHFDHLGGLRAYLHAGITPITHWRNADFYHRDVFVYDNGVAGREDLVMITPPTELAEGYFVEAFTENYALTDGERAAIATYVNPLDVEGMSMVFLPQEGILVQADLFNTHEPWPENPTEAEQDAAAALYRNVVQLGYEVQQVVPIHGSPVTWAEFLETTGVAEPQGSQ